MELRFAYTDPQQRESFKEGIKVMQLGNDTTLYAALETMVTWCIKRGLRVTGWSIKGRPARGF